MSLISNATVKSDNVYIFVIYMCIEFILTIDEWWILLMIL